MFRLRTMVGLSALALLVGIAGTAWLSSLTSDWDGPPAGHAVSHANPIRAVLRRHPRPARTAVAGAHHVLPPAAATTRSPAVADPPSLTPVDMPPLAASPWKREPLVNGRVLLRVSVNGAGQVTRAEVAHGSGNAGLDDRALRTVQHWRFAVPADHPDGLTGELLMRFDADSPPVARSP
ncbi:energy transducer TonB [Dyella solisilvae]|uniref:Energy transducer TonB n=1 Tax=Dyella solisilvae TaxID=1920168 RepID=A0A370K961_9GAMM|nr:energy transducer TonB [Dyella solisilvae]RDI99176.1 energy transducer TonB [Dyella solisilvae]